MPERPPGWYRDPEHPSGHRFWDGAKWTDNDEDDGDKARATS